LNAIVRPRLENGYERLRGGIPHPAPRSLVFERHTTWLSLI
jgi:hypothetical protein